ncbi:hypothetical protein PV646_06815 [Streptomyces sp. ID05-26A]|nr:hypothetical protein [Streptomyces sp. ID05-26A]
MVSVWVAVLGIVGTLAAAVLTQILTNRREFQRDQLRWAQERQEREFDVRKVAVADALTAINKWYYALHDLSLYVAFPHVRIPEVARIPELTDQAEHSYTAVDLFCSDTAGSMTREVLAALSAWSERLRELGKETEMNRAVDREWRTDAHVGGQLTKDKLERLRDIYRAELYQGLKQV